MKILTKIRREVKKEISELSRKDIFLIGVLILSLSFLLSPLEIKTLKVIAIFATLISYYFLIRKNFKSRDNFLKVFNIFVLMTLIFAAFSYTAASVKEMNVAAVSIFIWFMIMFLFSIILYVLILHKSKNIPIIIITYIAISVLTIAMFAFLFSVSKSFDGGVVWSDSKEMVDDNNNFYFSALVFYSNVFGDIIPLGISKIIVFVELIWSFVLHIIIIGEVISQLKRK